MFRGPSTESFDAPDDAYRDGQTALKAIDALQRLKDQPFFLAIGFHKPHLPFVAPTKYWDLYPESEVQVADNIFIPKNAPLESIHQSGELRGYSDISSGKTLKDPAKIRELTRGYLASVSFVDAQLGRVLSELDRLGLRDKTIVVLWGDHGWNLGEHTLWCKHANYSTSMRTPLIIRRPQEQTHTANQATQNIQSEALVELVDLYPSLCELAGLDKPPHLEGLSLVPLLSEPQRPWKEAVFCRYVDGDSVITKDFTYTTYRKKRGAGKFVSHMLYDLRTDPKENVSVVNQTDYQDTVSYLQRIRDEGWRPIAEKVSVP